MRAMVLERQRELLVPRELPVPGIAADELLIRVNACGVCRTDLHVVDGDLEEPSLPLVPGHQVVGVVEKVGETVRGFSPGDRVGVPWLGGSCGSCRFCREGRENLCDNAVYTGYQRDGGFAEYLAARAGFCFPLPEGYNDLQAAPLLCAGLIGYRAYRSVMDAPVLALYGFGAAAHILVQVARHRGQTVYAFTREGDRDAQRLALELGADWAGGSDQQAPALADAAVIFAPVGELVPLALHSLHKGGAVVCAGIHMSDIPSFPYAWLWGERSIRSVANLTRADGEEFLPLAASIPVKTTVSRYPLERANEALADLRDGRITGAAVIEVAAPA